MLERPTLKKNEKRYGTRQFLPIIKETIRTQLFGFGWAALETGDVKIAYSTLRALEALTIPEVIQRFKLLARVDKSTRDFWPQRRLKEETAIARAKIFSKKGSNHALKSLQRAEKALKAIRRILLWDMEI